MFMRGQRQPFSTHSPSLLFYDTPLSLLQVKQSKKLIGTDDKSNISNYKYTYLVDMCTLCKDDLVYLPAKLARTLGNISRTVLVKNVSNLIHLIDPLTAQTASMSGDQFWRYPIRPVITAARARLTRYIVLGKEAVVTDFNGSKKEATRKNKNRLATVTLAKESDLGINDKQFNERSHLGYLAKAGDICLAYDLTETQFVEDEAEEVRVGGKLPDVIVVRKLYGGAATGDVNAAKQRIWQLQRLDVEVAEDLKASKAKKNAEMDDMDEEDFLREVEADAEMRRNMNIYKSEVGKKKADGELKDDDDDDDDDDEDDQKVKLDELLDGLVLNDGPDAEDAGPRGEEDEMDDEEGFVGAFNEGERAAKDGITYVGRDRYRDIRDKDTAVPVASNVFGAEYMKDKTQFKFT
jgi:nonsense-mediated mRNA decay protein 3